MDPKKVECLRNRAILYPDLGKPAKAVRDYDEVIRPAPDDPSVRKERRVAAEETGLRE